MLYNTTANGYVVISDIKETPTKAEIFYMFNKNESFE